MDIKDIYKRVRAIDENQSVEECGDMMPLPMMPHSPAQADSVTMNVSMNGSGPGGIRDLMGILRNIEHGENPAQDAGGHDELDALFGKPETHDADVLLGAEPVDEEYGNSMQGASGEIEYDSAFVNNIGSNDGRAGSKARKVNGGENPMSESLVNRLQAHYESIKYNEAYNPNNVSAQHERELKAAHKAERKKKADAGDESSKKRLQAIHDKEEAQRNEFNARMER